MDAISFIIMVVGFSMIATAIIIQIDEAKAEAEDNDEM
jgi:hypothetical protein